ncbi:16S rRNA (cytosine1402-N4)-methyltransferase [Tepidamorphus gemmatus]|jgi:16S rRNA (cytosine1402-N4)-methyltransferase|uniref:Ribosomal RNA small subunit methyltransferase H n=1 Tax=Tepidamorphus gemmatus TaxID=747076 RepID=A0A4R3MJC0_9HYPH|nr:16S rRNA (cytosine(1402)-N(4))-methyltransferase RsmH [Tepidamorphus gemmatus]TCT13494.1 16S rRNA (cytosine1402-N4)-methyltransferase [Tepidamorphus gemmatus]
MMAGRGSPTGDAAGGPARHVPVLLAEALEALAPRDGGVYVDGTFGAGGYSRAILAAADCRVVAIDRDPAAIAAGAAAVAQHADRLILVEGRFSRLDEIAVSAGFDAVDGVALDVGVSSMQLDEAQRGFSFTRDGPLDMRMGGDGPSAADIVNSMDEADLARLIFVLGEERRSRAVARAIGRARSTRPIETTGELAEIVARAVGPSRDGRNPATRTFQALRIYVNGELSELAEGLFAAERILRAGGRLVVVTFHSLEDRIVKRFLADRAQATRPSRYMPDLPSAPPTFRLITRGAVTPGEAETEVNRRARSARLRAAERTDAAARPGNATDLGVPDIAVAGAAVHRGKRLQ